MKVFKEKSFGKRFKAAKKAILNNMANPIALTSLGVSGTGLYLTDKNVKANEKRLKQAEKQHKITYEQQERLINALTGVEKGLANLPKESPQVTPKKEESSWLKIGNRKIFSEKRYGLITADMAKGAMIGSALTPALALSFMKQNGTPRAKAATVLIGSALGALAGAFWGATKAVDSKISQSMSGHKLIREVIKNLERAGYKKDIEWTTDPKKASLMKTKVCIVISRSSDELGLLVNMASDPELKKVSAEVVKNLPWGSKATEKVSDRFNEIQISSIPAKTDATYIFGKIEKFIQAGFPVYLMEVG